MSLSLSRFVVVVLSLVLSLALFSACTPPPFVEGQILACDAELCVCQPDDLCRADCPEGGCNLECANGDNCEAACAGGCSLSCHDVDNCITDCGDDCDLDCDRLSSCNTTCGADCRQSCRDVGNCDFEVGPGSTVVCERVGNCNVRCDGACSVACDNTGNCNVTCADDDTNAVTCDDGVTRVCGDASCP